MAGESNRREQGGSRFPAERRIRKRADFLRIQSGGRRITTPSYVLLVLARPDDEPARLGITVTRKYGGAAKRNRAKRLVREAFRLHPELFPRGADVVVVVRGHVEGLAQAVEEFRSIADRLARRVSQLRASLAQGDAVPQNPPKFR